MTSDRPSRPAGDESLRKMTEHYKQVNDRHEAALGSAFGDDLATILTEVRTMLLEKNEAYGDSALDPVRVFSKCSPEEQLRVRIDDKLSRLSRGSAAGEDVIQDLLGYLLLLKIARLRQTRAVEDAAKSRLAGGAR